MNIRKKFSFEMKIVFSLQENKTTREVREKCKVSLEFTIKVKAAKLMTETKYLQTASRPFSLFLSQQYLPTLPQDNFLIYFSGF